MITYSSEPLAAYVYQPQSDGTARLWLRRNIERSSVDPQDGGEPYDEYSAEEVQLITELPESEVLGSFDRLWARAEAEAKTVGQRVDEVEDVIDAIIEVLLGE